MMSNDGVCNIFSPLGLLYESGRNFAHSPWDWFQGSEVISVCQRYLQLFVTLKMSNDGVCNIISPLGLLYESGRNFAHILRACFQGSEVLSVCQRYLQLFVTLKMSIDVVCNIISPLGLLYESGCNFVHSPWAWFQGSELSICLSTLFAVVRNTKDEYRWWLQHNFSSWTAVWVQT